MFDHVFLHKALGIPIFLAMLWAVFQFTFFLSEPFMVMIGMIFGWLGGLAEELIANPHLASFVAGGSSTVWVLFWYSCHRYSCYFWPFPCWRTAATWPGPPS